MENEINEIKKKIERSNKILVICHNNFNAEHVSAGLGLFAYLKKLKKEANIITSNKNNHTHHEINFLPNYKEINKITASGNFTINVEIAKNKLNKIKYVVEENSLKFFIDHKDENLSFSKVTASSDLKYDLIICVGVNKIDDLGEVHEKNLDTFQNNCVINLDYNIVNENFGNINFIDIHVNSIAQVVAKIIDHSLIDNDISTCLLTAVINKTNHFKNKNVTASLLELSSKLIDMGARRDEIIQKLYVSRQIETIRLWGKILTDIKSEYDNKLIWFALDKESNPSNNDTENSIINLVDELIITIKNLQIIVAFYIKNNSGKPVTHALIFCLNNFDAQELIKGYEIIGNNKLVKITSLEPLEQFKSKVLSQVKRKFKTIFETNQG
ncbi:MAG: hypothetical protein NT091_03830 [Candidatus Falkowbacteria bacterium]|nr:hypothetical protein [Candidatus Falkowbacteria bacterium]